MKPVLSLANQYIELTESELSSVRLGRLANVRREMTKKDIGSCILVDPINIRYATDSRNMQIYTARHPARYLFLPLEGPVILFEFAGCKHLAEHLETINEVRIAKSSSFLYCVHDLEKDSENWASELADLIKKYGSNKTVGVERINFLAGSCLQAKGFKLVDAQEPLEFARSIKLPNEIKMIRSSIQATEDGVKKMHEALKPGMTENELWAILNKHVIETDGDYIETRLLTSGIRTNPWFQECSAKVIEKGELVAFDTDVIGRYGYFADFSRTILCGDANPTPEQKDLYKLAYEQIQTNLGLIKVGASFQEVSDKSWTIPDKYLKNRYFNIVHGNGMNGEYPLIPCKMDFVSTRNEGVIKENMTLSVESYIGSESGGEGVKLEEHILVTKDGVEILSKYPFEDKLR